MTVYSRYINCIFLYLGTQDRVRDQIFKHVQREVRPKYSATRRILRACPPEDQAEVIHAISPISVKLGQIEGHTQ